MSPSILPSIHAGRMRSVLTFYTKTLTLQSDGSKKATYTNVFATGVRAEMDPQGGKKFFDSMKFNVENFTTMMMRYMDGIDETMRIEDETGTMYEILNFQDIAKRRRQMIFALRELKG